MKVSLMTLAFGFCLVVGFPLAATAGPTPGGADGDGDTVEDAFDNCSETANADQADANHDGCGDACSAPVTCDGNNNGIVGGDDFILLAQQFGNTAPPNTMDCNDNGIVGGDDFIILAQEFGNVVGPSGITNPSRTCP